MRYRSVRHTDPSSPQIYADVKIGIHDDPNFKLSKPLGFSAFAKEILPVPERWIAATGRLVFHRDHPAVSERLTQRASTW